MSLQSDSLEISDASQKAKLHPSYQVIVPCALCGMVSENMTRTERLLVTSNVWG